MSALRPASSPPLRIAVFGATGRIGRLLQAAWADAPDVAPVWLGRRSDGAAAQAVMPVTAPSLAAHLPDCDALICLAGPSGGPARVHADHATLARLSLEAAELAGVPTVFLMSSAAIYGAAPGPLTEDRSPSPLSDYARGKAALETVAARWQGRSRPVVLRLCNVAGADSLLGGLVPGRLPRLDTFPDGHSPRRSYIGPRTLAACLSRLAAHARNGDLPGLLNLAAPGSVEMADLLTANGTGWEPVPAPPGALASVCLDTRRIEALCPFPPASRTAAGIVAEWAALRDRLP